MSNVAMMRPGSALMPIYPQSFEDAVRFARMAVSSGVLKRQKTGFGQNAIEEPEDATLARGTMLVLQGMEVGLPPMQALQLMALINGRITAHSEAVPGILLAHGFKIKERWTGTPMADDWTCFIELTRPNGDKHEGGFSVADAKQAKLWDQSPTKSGYEGKTKPNDSAWFRFPKRMIKARALGFVAKDFAGDALKGIQVREEADDMVSAMRDVTPAVLAVSAPTDIPDEPVAEPEIDDPPIADEAGYLARLQSLRDQCESVQELQELAVNETPMIVRLSDAGQTKASEILREEG